AGGRPTEWTFHARLLDDTLYRTGPVTSILAIASLVRSFCKCVRSPFIPHRPTMLNKPIALSALLLATACSTAPAPSNGPSPDRTAQGRSTDTTRAGGDTSRAGANAPAQPRPYNRVITRDAKTRRGMFAVHRVNDKLYFEIPRKEL